MSVSGLIFRFLCCENVFVCSRETVVTEDGHEVQAFRYQSFVQVISYAFQCICSLFVDIPKDERPHAHLQPVVIEGAPPSAQDDLATR